MSEKKVSRRAGGHTAVSNQPEDEGEFFIEKAVSEAPSEGEGARTGRVNEDGTEAVAGHKKTEAAMIAEGLMAGIYTAPDTSKLRDIGEASFGPRLPAIESVIGPDDRWRVMDTTIFPWRVHAFLLITAADNSQWLGTAWFIGPHTLMTAGHCVYIKNSGVPGRDGWVTKIIVMPGRNGDILPFGAVTSTSFRSVTGWTQDGNPNYDYGAIIIPTDLGNTTGWFGFGVYSDAHLLGSLANIAGYPADKSPAGTQWYDNDPVVSVNSRKVYYKTDTYGGQSGSAVYRIIDGGRYGDAIHAYGVGGSITSNSGSRIVTPVFNNMLAWKA